jgi:acetyl esterase/lipase
VLKYRLGSSGYRHPAMLNDAARAMRTVRANAQEWKIDPTRVGVIGSSAGGHLAATLLTHFDNGDPLSTDTVARQGCRPDLGVLCYPVITAVGAAAHSGSIRNLLGDAPSAELLQLLSNENQVTSRTPPTFLFHTADDTVVKVQNSLIFAAALADANVPFELHIYPRGAHGMGLGAGRTWDPEHRHPWTKACEAWLKLRGFARKPGLKNNVSINY